MLEIGAGTGKGTEVLALLGAPLTCVEPDPRMAAVLRGRFPDATVLEAPFEALRPVTIPSDGQPLRVDLDARNGRVSQEQIDELGRHRHAEAVP